ncbi:DUF563 domain-containing protein [Halalkalibacterium halodurans]|uniref:Glycosyltransferase 61 catalytic domain-containing protein n=1 Tax=Halalkalibacterium halodurans TaxID=86665 RepID=A0A0M0KGH1_ALKHA|nr:DUF563 domain-containing protein [Halalkalibacterium halodurans]MED4080644.1 DUF563 domain-containing protein [Halalkalibacterium halodurans]MED4085669.1 DUF563 domain-containing protein [Halalkalibacterium halodurans]MED4106331.1 DUF563 domain-containing protein [Halalkalibacterium halodurans]MED4108527.1 DUF563 domain-containing protein [Halalkalibacterium halodurans]MED4124743.1 DUF563 domain-containing protein [Halalkalibacterium halodurans]
MVSLSQGTALSITAYENICEQKEIQDFTLGPIQRNYLYFAGSPETVKIKPPIRPFPNQSIPSHCETKPFYLASIKQPMCVKHQVILYKQTSLLPDSFRHETRDDFHQALHYDLKTKQYRIKRLEETTRWLPGDSLFLSGEFSGEYGHFLLEILSRLWITDFIQIQSLPILMNPTDRKQWQLDLLKPFGIKKPQIVPLHQPTVCERLHIPVQSFSLRRYTSSFAHKVWKTIGDYYDTGSQQVPDKIYVSRSRLKSNRRRLINETDVERLFSRNGFQIIHPQELTIKEQINLFRHAQVIAGPLGSAMYNCVFQTKPTKKLLLTYEKFIKMSDLLINTSTNGLLYYFAGTEHKQNKSPSNTEWSINLNQLAAYLENF